MERPSSPELVEEAESAAAPSPAALPSVDEHPGEGAEEGVRQDGEEGDPEDLLGGPRVLQREPGLPAEHDVLGQAHPDQPVGRLGEPLRSHEEGEVAATQQGQGIPGDLHGGAP